MSEYGHEIRIHEDLSDIEAAEWNAMVSAGNPFLEYEFLRNLEVSGSLGPRTGWIPHYIVLRRGSALRAALPLYEKRDSYGEFVFDFEWARLHQQHGLAYYPKGVVAVPFTPATGERFLLAPGEEALRGRLLEAAQAFAEERKWSSLHFLFLREEECEFLEARGFWRRTQFQFHWKNHGYQSFDDYLAALQHKRKNQILRERRRVEALGLEILVLKGDQIQSEHLEAMWRMSARTFMHKSGDLPYLTEAFFRHIYESMRPRCVMVMAREGGQWVAGSINFEKGKNLYGRYWGALRDYPFLHFECCFYRLIDYSIQNGIELFEAGAQGEQKFFRGFETCPTYSMHWVREPALHQTIGRFLAEESRFARKLIEDYNAISPLKRLREGV